MTNKCLIILVVLFISNSLSSQKIDNLSSFRDVENDHYFRFNYDNDLERILGRSFQFADEGVINTDNSIITITHKDIASS